MPNTVNWNRAIVAVAVPLLLAAVMLGIGVGCCDCPDVTADARRLPQTPVRSARTLATSAPATPVAAQQPAVPPTVAVEPVVTPSPAATEPEGDAGDVVVFADLNWTSARIQNRIAQYIIEHGYGYRTEAIGGSTNELFDGLRRGQVDVTMEIWLPLQDRDWLAAVAEGEVRYVGSSLGSDWQSTFVIPAYLQEEFPDLDHVDDLQDPRFRQLFATSDSGGKARLMGCVAGWACQEVNDAQIAGYGLSEHIQTFRPDSQEALFADLYGAYAKRKPWLGYMWGTADPAVVLELTPLEEPAYNDQCWYTHKACAFEPTTIITAVNSDLPGRAPALVHLLEQWDFGLVDYRDLLRWMNENDADEESAALHWLRTERETLRSWITEKAYAGVEAALDSGLPADGWPQ